MATGDYYNSNDADDKIIWYSDFDSNKIFIRREDYLPGLSEFIKKNFPKYANYNYWISEAEIIELLERLVKLEKFMDRLGILGLEDNKELMEKE